MVFKKFMAKLGKGAAQVDLVLDNQEYMLGEQVNGELIIQGGTIEQDINKIDVDFLMNVRVGEHEHTALIHRFQFHDSFKIQPSERKTFPFSYDLPQNLLLSGYSVSYYFITHLDIAGGVDSTDRDHIHVTPPQRFQNILTALGQLGFREKYGSRSFDGHMQEFEFTPTSFLKDEVQEVEFVAAIEEEGIRLLLEVDLYSFTGEKEVKREVWLENQILDDPDQLVAYLQQILADTVQNPSVYYYDKKHFYHKISGLSGAIGAFAVGLIAAEIFEEALEEIFEDEETDEESPDEDEGFLEDFFGGDEED
ncbi:sporulation protein [Paenactinomyces guangxiensis]|uniref:Sporulation protein n=1 Tax=Paenactinomyces guangxiensis TaxID=1490290 RepID=A0A7W1WPY8_9BACL|nr:sporulation protein [Paenactinomyces guangxiensis]MBA4493928.1 sporulation protein [Paenactinomyces guangxiensis]MBH8591395.1 sporulation protein [Paenactinomyces guangxiensis]